MFLMPKTGEKMSKVIFEQLEHRYFLDNKEYPSQSKIMKHFGMTPDYDRFGNDSSRNFGTAVHKVCELYDKNDLGEFDPLLKQYLDGYKRFMDHYKPEWQLIEVPLVSKVWGFATTPDRFGIINKKTASIDLKTGTEEPHHEIQSGFHQIVIEENLKVKVKERYTLILLPNDFRLILHKNPSDKSIAISLAQIYRWKLNHGKIKE